MSTLEKNHLVTTSLHKKMIKFQIYLNELETIQERRNAFFSHPGDKWIHHLVQSGSNLKWLSKWIHFNIQWFVIARN